MKAQIATYARFSYLVALTNAVYFDLSPLREVNEPGSRGRKLILGVEGNVCAGKTSVVRLLSERYAIPFVPEYWELMTQGEQDALLAQPLVSRLRFLLSIEQERYDATIGTSDSLTLDRTILTIIATHFALQKISGDANRDDIGTLLTKYRHWRPDIFIFLDSPLEVQAERRRLRGGDDALFVSPRFAETFRRIFTVLSQSLPIIVIDTGGLGIEKIAEQARGCFRCPPVKYSLAHAINELETKL